ncbi:mucin-2-like [Penaeus japonicus]|uniref:mucin-2-like n=1 Tax=Penaeus japonicus TaxID=27405 RepID=UPI001C712874|nr:mucin-2-like [Penaeus japonicus]
MTAVPSFPNAFTSVTTLHGIVTSIISLPGVPTGVTSLHGAVTSVTSLYGTVTSIISLPGAVTSTTSQPDMIINETSLPVAPTSTLLPSSVTIVTPTVGSSLISPTPLPPQMQVIHPALATFPVGAQADTDDEEATSVPSSHFPSLVSNTTQFPSHISSLPTYQNISASGILPSICQPTCLIPDSWLADPTDCHYFYVCHFIDYFSMKPQRIKCPEDKPVFSQDEGKCMSSIQCVVACPGITATAPPPAPDATSCQPKCIIPNSLVPDPMDCTHYYICVFLRGQTPHPVRARCPSTKPFFHRTKFRCEAEARCIEMCSIPSTSLEPTVPPTVEEQVDPCLPSCVRPESVVKDPKDCHHYYTCTVNGNTTILTRMECPSSRPIYDVESESCSEFAECLVTCQQSETQLTNGTDDALMLIPETCRPNCSQHNTILHDPMDCHYYYVCMIVQGQAHTTRIRCPPSRPVFQLESYSCRAESPCITTCQETNLITPGMSNISIPTASYLPTSATTEYPSISSSSSIMTLSPTATPTYSSTSPNLCRPTCSSQHTVVHDPLDCNHFYTCTITRLKPYPQYTPVRGKCPSERPVFDLEKHSCAAGIPCITTCEGIVATTPTTLSTSSTLSSEVTPIILPGDDESCIIHCEKPNSIVRDPTSCHHYYLCIFFDGTVPRPLRLRCPREKPVFDSESKTCQGDAPCRTLHCQQTDSNSTQSGPFTPSPAGFINNSPTTEETISVKPTLEESTSTKPTQESTSSTKPIPERPSTITPTAEELITTITTPEETIDTSKPDGTSPTTEPVTTSQIPGVITTSPTSDGTIDTSPTSEGIVNTGSTSEGIVNTGSTSEGIVNTGSTPETTFSSSPKPEETTSTSVTTEGTLSTGFTLNTSPTLEVTPQTMMSDYCKPKCKHAGILIPDLSDCTRYYACMFVNGLVPQPVLARCPKNKPIFNNITRRCVETAQCYAPCSTQVETTSSNPVHSSSISPVPSPTETSLTTPQDLAATGCSHAGFFAKSNLCIGVYTHCYHDGNEMMRVTRQCPPGLVFNTVSTYPYCVPPSDCPYDPALRGPSANVSSCAHPGSFPRCQHCCTDYIQCETSLSGRGYTPTVTKCPGGLVFNTDPTYPVCLRPQDCPTGGGQMSQCNRQGNYPACPGCCRDYFHCTHDKRLQRKTCPHPLVFNPLSSYPYCVLPWNCPYVLPSQS